MHTGDIPEVYLVIEEFVCRMYSLKKIINVNEARVAVFMKNYKINDGDEIFQTNAKNVDGATLPPCKAELHKQIKRTAFIAHLWRHAYLPQPTEFSPTDYGWEESENKLIFQWFDGDQLPQSIDDIAINSTENQDITNKY